MYKLKGFLLYFTSTNYIILFSLINYTSIREFPSKMQNKHNSYKFQGTTAVLVKQVKKLQTTECSQHTLADFLEDACKTLG